MIDNEYTNKAIPADSMETKGPALQRPPARQPQRVVAKSPKQEKLFSFPNEGFSTMAETLEEAVAKLKSYKQSNKN